MTRAVFILALVSAAVLGAAAYGATPLFDDPGETREALRQALTERKLAEERSKRLEAEAARATQAADKTRREAAALAARIQQAEAGIAAAEARIKLVDRERAALREELGHQQGPLVRLTAALQQFSRRPAALAILRPGSVRDIVYTRALLSSAVPTVQRQTAGLRARLARSRALRQQAVQAAAVLRSEQENYDTRRAELAALETRQRLASREAGGNAAREAERALALAEQARDLDSLVGQLDKAGDLRRRLAALPGPVLRPPAPELARNDAVPEPAALRRCRDREPAIALLPSCHRSHRQRLRRALAGGAEQRADAGSARRGAGRLPGSRARRLCRSLSRLWPDRDHRA